jgi:hypothetical protein
MSILSARESAFNTAKALAKDNKKDDLYESLVVQYTNPKGEWGRNNMRDLVMLFHMSGHSPEKIYNILYTMGVEKQDAYNAIQSYIPQNNTISMTVNVKEQLDFTNKLRNLVDAMNEYKTEDSANYNADAVINVCEGYLNTDKTNLSISQVAGMAKRLVSDLNRFDFISPVRECINVIESTLYENIMTLQVNNLHNNLSNSNQKGMFSNVIDRLESLKSMNESEIRKNVNSELRIFESWIPEVGTVLENAQMIEGVDKVNKTKTLSERFNLKGRLKEISENADSMKTDNSLFTMNNVKSICEKYISRIYSQDKSVTESQLAVNAITELSQFEWLGFVKESINNIGEFLKENYMSFEVEWALKDLQKNNNRSFYSPAISKLQSIKGLNESEIRENIKYAFDELTWVPQVKRLVETVNALEGNLSNNTEAIVEKKFSPVLEKDGTVYFYLSGAVYGLNENNITMIDPKTMGALYLTLIAVTENFKFGTGTLTRYKGKNVISFELNESGTAFKFNGEVIPVKESNDIRNFLLANGSVKINETSELQMLVKAYENINSFVELDFVQSVASRTKKGVTANVIRVGENVYINRINPAMRMNEMLKAESATEAITLVKEHVNYDISSSLVDLLEGEQKIAAELSAKRDSMFDRIQFLKEQRSKLSIMKNTSNVQVLEEADRLLVSEIEKWQTALNELN